MPDLTVDYQLHSLGWKAFQDLCATVLSEIWGQTVQSFADVNDGGRDGAFHGTWAINKSESLSGSFTLQCKFTRKANALLNPSDCEEEVSKANRLSVRGLADNYILLTNAGLTGATEGKLCQRFLAVPGIKQFRAFGREWLTRQISQSANLRRLVPRLYGLGDLSQILDERAYDQAREVQSSLGDDLGRFVITDAFRSASEALRAHGFVLLLGEPACGKSTIAAALTLGAIDSAKCRTMKVRSADEFVHRRNPHEPKQLFWVDDAFGATQLEWQRVTEWNQTFPHVQAAIRKGALFLFTSRDYVFQAAKWHLKESALPVLHESQVVIRVNELSKEEKQQILFNHIRLGDQPKDVKRQLKPHLPAVAEHLRFTPEIARRLGNPLFTRGLFIDRDSLNRFVAEPVHFLTGVIRNLDAHSQGALALVFLRGGRVESPIEFSTEDRKALESLGADVAKVRRAMSALEGSFVLLVHEQSVATWRFKHPTMRDALAQLFAEDRERLDVYLAGAPLPTIFREVTCGDIGLSGVKVIVPASRYAALVERTKTIRRQETDQFNELINFLARRCDREFLRQFLDASPGFVEKLRVWSYFDAVSEVALLVLLIKSGLVSSAERQRVVKSIARLAVETPDHGIFDDDIRSIFSVTEFDAVLADIRENVIERFEDVLDNWQSNYDREKDPHEYYQPLTECLNQMLPEFSDDPEAVAQLNEAIEKLEEAIDSEEGPDGDSGWYSRDDSKGTPLSYAGERSIFDDVDD